MKIQAKGQKGLVQRSHQKATMRVLRHLSIKLCLKPDSKYLLEASLELGIELMKSGMDGTRGRFPLAIVEV